MGRPSRKPVDSLRTKIWFEAVRTGLGLKTAYDMDRYFGTGKEHNWYKYRDGTRVPKQETLADIERVVAGSRRVFDVGPSEGYLWKALAGPHDQLWEVIDHAFPDRAEDRKNFGLGLLQYQSFIKKRLIPDRMYKAIDYVEFQRGEQPNAIAIAVQKGEICIAQSDVACGIAFWRLSDLVKYDMMFANYLLTGLEVVFDRVYGGEVGVLLRAFTRGSLLGIGSHKYK